MKKNDSAKKFDFIEVGCDSWRSWERVGNELPDWKGVMSRTGFASDDLDNKINTCFSISIYTLRSHSKQIFERLKSYRGVTKVRWTRDFGNPLYMDIFGNWK